MNILVTGGAGNVGKGVVKYLVAHGHQIRVFDRKVETRQAGVEYNEGDITNFDVVREQVRGIDGIVHLAAYPNPAVASGPEIFRVNAAGTYNIFEAAAAEGIRRVSVASSINAFGFGFGVKEFPIRYFPIDENHPTFTTDPYSFSKGMTEEIAAYYWRRDGISSTCMRMPAVYTLNAQWVEMAQKFLPQIETGLTSFFALSAGQQAERAADFKAQMDERRVKRLAEVPFNPDEMGPEEEFDPVMMLFFGYPDFWAIISVEDAAQAFEKSLLADFEGSHPLFITEAENSAGVESERVLKLMFPEVNTRIRPIPGTSNILSYDHAHDLIGFEPTFILRERIQQPFVEETA